MNLEQKVTAVGNLVLISEDVENWSFGESNPMGFDGFTADEFRRGPKEGDSDNRVGVLWVETMNDDLINGAIDKENAGVVWGLTDGNVTRPEPIGDTNGERGPIHARTFHGVDSGVLTPLQEPALPVDHAMNKDVKAVEKHVGATNVETGLPPGRVDNLDQFFLPRVITGDVGFTGRNRAIGGAGNQDVRAPLHDPQRTKRERA